MFLIFVFLNPFLLLKIRKKRKENDQAREVVRAWGVNYFRLTGTQEKDERYLQKKKKIPRTLSPKTLPLLTYWLKIT